MGRFGTALTILLATCEIPSNVQSFQTCTLYQTQSFRNAVGQGRQQKQEPFSQSRPDRKFQRNVASSSSNPEFSNGSGEILEEAISTVTTAARDSIANAVRDEPDADEAEIALKQQLVQERTKTYTVTLPLTSSSIIEEQSPVLAMGMTLVQITKGREVGDLELNLDTLEFFESDCDASPPEGQERMDKNSLMKRIDGEFQGLVVASVVENGAAWSAGIRPGDIVMSTSATVGSQLWPKSTLDGVRSVIQSRKAVSGSIQFALQRIGEAIDNQYELTLSKPIGLELKESEDGFVEVCGFTPNAPTLVQYAVKVGDRVLAVDSSLGDRMWPVSTVDGVISSVTSRLPGQQITFRFQRPSAMMNEVLSEPVTISRPKKEVVAAPPAIGHNELLERCREVIRRYTKGGVAAASVKGNFVDKYSLPGMVADKVVDALASAGTRVDPVTLSMVMGAYISCRQPEKAIEVFEGVVGLSADGSDQDTARFIKGKNENQIEPTSDALDIYTVSALLKAQAMTGDLSAVRRVLAAIGGRDDSVVDGLKVASWPGTGPDGTLHPNTRCYNIAISALADSSDENGLDLAMQIFYGLSDPRLKKDAGQKRDIVSYNAIINALTSRGRYDEAIDLFYEMKRSGVQPDKYSYTSMVKAVGCQGESDLEELFYDMKEQGVSPDPVLFNTVIKSLCSQRRIVAAKKIVTKMEAAGVFPDSITYGLLMKGLLDTGNPSAALTLFESACSDQLTTGLTENVYLYTTAISAAAAVADHERALELLSRMNSMGIRPNLKTMTALVGACIASKKHDLAYDIYKRIVDPDGYAMLQGIRALCGFGRADKALDIMSKEESRVLSGKERMFAHQSVIESSLMRGDYAIAKQAFSQILKRGNIPSKGIYQSIFDTLGLFPKTLGGMRPVVRLNEETEEKFTFLLFVLDSVLARNLPCEGPLYSAILSYGAQLGSLPRRLASLLVSSRGFHEREGTELLKDDGEQVESIVSSWEELFLRYNDLKASMPLGPSSLPPVSVRVNSRNVARVLKAENSISYAKRRPRQKEV